MYFNKRSRNGKNVFTLLSVIIILFFSFPSCTQKKQLSENNCYLIVSMSDGVCPSCDLSIRNMILHTESLTKTIKILILSKKNKLEFAPLNNELKNIKFITNKEVKNQIKKELKTEDIPIKKAMIILWIKGEIKFQLNFSKVLDYRDFEKICSNCDEKNLSK